MSVSARTQKLILGGSMYAIFGDSTVARQVQDEDLKKE